MRRADRQPAHRVVKPVHRFIPGTHCNAATAAAGPFSFIHSPENDTLFCVNIPFAKARIIVDGIRYFLAGFAPRDGTGGTKFGAAFTGHTKIVRAERNGFIGLQRQIRRHGL